MNTKYCLKCEREVNVLVGCDGTEFHLIFVPAGYDYPAEVDTCEGVFTMSEPPAFTEEDWAIVFANEPSQEELQEMDKEAESLVIGE